MGFWKRLFNPSKTKEKSRGIPFKGELVDRNIYRAEGRQILFSTEREIDVYELEELCDRVGWARRPIRKVKKALKYSFLVVCMWEVRGSHRRDVAQLGSAPALGAGCRRFKSCHPDFIIYQEFPACLTLKNLCHN
jgi:hypothetical protein